MASNPQRLAVSADHRAAVDTWRRLDDALIEERKRIAVLRERHRAAEELLYGFMKTLPRTLISDGSSIAAQPVKAYAAITLSLIASACDAEGVDQRLAGRLLHRIQRTRAVTVRNKISRRFYHAMAT